MARLLEFRHALLRGSRVVQQGVEIGTHRQPAGFSNLGNQAARIVFPATLGHFASVPYREQRLQFRWQLLRWHVLDGETFDQRGHQCDGGAVERRDQLVTHHVVFVVQSG